MVAHQVGKAMKAADSRFRGIIARSCVVKPTIQTISRRRSHRERKTRQVLRRPRFHLASCLTRGHTDFSEFDSSRSSVAMSSRVL